MTTFTLSAHQYTMLLQLQGKGWFGKEYACMLAQTTFGSLLKRGYVTWDSNRQMFHIAANGHNAIQWFKEADIWRKISSGHLSHYFKEY